MRMRDHASPIHRLDEKYWVGVLINAIPILMALTLKFGDAFLRQIFR